MIPLPHTLSMNEYIKLHFPYVSHPSFLPQAAHGRNPALSPLDLYPSLTWSRKYRSHSAFCIGFGGRLIVQPFGRKYSACSLASASDNVFFSTFPSSTLADQEGPPVHRADGYSSLLMLLLYFLINIVKIYFINCYFLFNYIFFNRFHIAQSN